jgi:(p)ppGpp synthase/HD superfamily hydrolase
MELEQKAKEFATKAHAGQKRKYTGADYIEHPAAVVKIVREVPHTEEMLAAAWLHDVVEACGVPISEIREEFGDDVASLVDWLTDVSKPTDGNRKKRKNLDLLHTATASPAAKTIKLADLIDNTSSIVQYDPEFAKVYLEEKKALLDVLKEGDFRLWTRAWIRAHRSEMHEKAK